MAALRTDSDTATAEAGDVHAGPTTLAIRRAAAVAGIRTSRIRPAEALASTVVELETIEPIVVPTTELFPRAKQSVQGLEHVEFP